MKNAFIIAGLSCAMFACSDQETVDLLNEIIPTEQSGRFERLIVQDESSLLNLIENGTEGGLKSASADGFVSLMSTISSNKSGDIINSTYYETLGYDTLVPNHNFARLLNPDGEIEVAGDIIRITPHGTFKYPKSYEAEFLKLLETTESFDGYESDNGFCKINDNLTLFLTFDKSEDDYSLIYDGDYTELDDSYFGDDDEDDYLLYGGNKSVSEPDTKSFSTFSADRKTVVGKFLQGLFGTSKKHTIKFSSKRRLGGSFYDYRYIVYSESGAQGWTDKKNWIGWSKTASDELRVGWKNVVLKKTVKNHYEQAMKSVKASFFMPTQYIEVNGQRINAATLVMPDFKPELKDKIIKGGVVELHKFLKREFSRPASEWEKAQAFIIASQTELYFIICDEKVRRYNTKSYTHVFAKNFADIIVKYSNTNGFSVNNIGANNYNDIKSWLNAIEVAVNQKHAEVVSGEVYVCARFGNNWRGMKIIKN